jgi:flagellar basal-body rod protein FlgF
MFIGNINRVVEIDFSNISDNSFPVKFLWHIDCSVVMQNKGRRKMGYDVSDIAIAGARKLTQLDFIANNIANVSTNGFKSEHLYYAMKGKDAQEGARSDLGLTSIVMDFAQGTLQSTGNSLDIGIEGDGFFAIQQNDGTTTYTRNGSFVLNKNRELVTKSGQKVLGDSGSLIINGAQINIDGDGTIQVDGNLAGKIKIVSFANPGKLTRTAEGQYSDDGSAGLKKNDQYRVASGYLEGSNVNAMKEMVEMIDGHRSFEAYQKIIQTMSDLDKLSTTRIGRLA